jgi:hypothetical protein
MARVSSEAVDGVEDLAAIQIFVHTHFKAEIGKER